MSRLRVLVAHNAYQQRGGEDAVVEAEVELLRRNGHTVELLLLHNDSIAGLGRFDLLARTLWSAPGAELFRATAAAFLPDVVHVHNTFPLLSPSIYWAAGRLRLPVVQTLHNFRLLCPQAMFLRGGSICEDCLGNLPWRGAIRGCYRDSAAQTSVLAGMLTLHRALGTWQNKVTRYVALNEFCRKKFVAGGLPGERILVKPNFVDFDAPVDLPRAGFLFVGRLSAEKGVRVLAQAARSLPDATVRVAGGGPEEGALAGVGNIVKLGALSGEEVRLAMSGAMALLLPSIWYENFPRTLVEAMACGLPVIASRIGALAELVEDGVTGLLFEPGQAEDLAAKMRWAMAHPDEMAPMGRTARLRYEALYTPERNYEQLIAIYRETIAAAQERSRQ
ncbi:glycosyltransferase family 4 protein [Rhodocyclus tenuis]|uniref:Glycosyltransferase involved in cell wall biosynthesis n=1 Tax=Rhodocyclus tenuis TaxID=1066 RepID=A0A840FYK9_RHOTE|nr:glycosyltransferase family 4 protein [Rhodocyclus tenuis]MBB4247207.1 glycosyltransferase involved in cell wall biosynthesis [Rhodocyclus tenuis]